LPGKRDTFTLGRDIRWVARKPLPEGWAELVDLAAAALNQNTQHDREQNTGDDTNESNAVHDDSPWGLKAVNGRPADEEVPSIAGGKERHSCRSLSCERSVE